MLKPLASISRAQIALWVLYGLPLLLLLWFVADLGVNVPYWDEWGLVELFRKTAAHTVGWQDLWAQNNEHRLLFPKIVFIVLAWLSNWNTKLESYTSIGLVILTFWAIHRLAYCQSELSDQRIYFSSIFTSICLFSLVQWENWLWGFQLAWFLVNACFAIALLVLTSRIGNAWLKLALASLLCFIASLSLAQGLLTWIAMIPALITSWRGRKTSQKITLFCAWIGLFLASAYLYSIGYQKPTNHLDIYGYIRLPLLAANYFFTLLGTPLLYQSKYAAIPGLVLFVSFIGFVGYYVRHINSPIADRLSPWVSLGLFTILFAGITTIGRTGLGIEQAASSRYITVSILLVISLIHLWRVGYSERHPRVASLAVFLKSTTVGGVLALLVLMASIAALPMAEDFHARLVRGQSCLDIGIEQTPDSCLQLLYPDVASLKAAVKDLTQIGFRQPSQPVTFLSQPSQTYGYIDAPPESATQSLAVQQNCLNCGDIGLSGWAILPDRHRSAQLVFISYGNPNATFLTNAYVNSPSLDVAKSLRDSRYARSRWGANFSPKLLPIGETLVKAWVYDPDDRQFVLLTGVRKLRVEE